MDRDALKWELSTADPGLALSLEIRAPSWVPPASAGLVRGAYTPSHLLRRLQLPLAHPCRGRLSTQLLPLGCIKPLGCFHPRECPVPRPLPPEGKKERWPPAGKACILPSLQKPGTGPKRGAASVHSAISGALRGTRRPARRLGGATERQVGCKP